MCAGLDVSGEKQKDRHFWRPRCVPLCSGWSARGSAGGPLVGIRLGGHEPDAGKPRTHMHIHARASICLSGNVMLEAQKVQHVVSSLRRDRNVRPEHGRELHAIRQLNKLELSPSAWDEGEDWPAIPTKTVMA